MGDNRFFVNAGLSRIDAQFDCGNTQVSQIAIANVGDEALDLEQVMVSDQPNSPFCEDWREHLPPPGVQRERGTVELGPAAQRVDAGALGAVHLSTTEDELRVRLQTAATDFRLSISPHAILETPWHAGPSNASFGLWTDCAGVDCEPRGRVWRLPLQDLGLTKATEQTWTLRLTGQVDERIEVHEWALIWPADSFDNHLSEIPNYQPVPPTRWNRIRHFPLHPSRLGPANADIVNAGHMQLMADLGLDGIGLVNPHPNLIPGFVEQVSAVDDLGLDLQNFFVIPFWRDDALRADYRRWSRAIGQAARACAPDCPTLLWNLVDEPGIHDAARCVRDLTTRPDRGDLVEPLDALADAACEPGVVCPQAPRL